MSRPQASDVLTPELRRKLTTRTDFFLYRIVSTNLESQYGSQALSLAPFREALSPHGIAVADAATLLRNFRDHVPLTDYESYKSWVARFDESPCTEARVKDLLAPGLPDYLAMSSSTSGKEPKIIPTYQCPWIDYPAQRPVFDFRDTRGPIAWIFYYGYKGVKEVERESGSIMKRIPLCLASTGRLRATFGWDIESDESRLSTIMPLQVAPWGANLIRHNRSFLMIHALFCRACSDLDQIFVTFAPFFIDFVRHIDEEWDMLLICIWGGRIPDLDGIDHLYSHLQMAFSANPARADILRDIGPPSRGDGWAARVWPRLRKLAGVCSGVFGTCLPQVRAILGPTVSVRNHAYGSSESCVSVFFDPDDPETFVFETEDVVEFVHAEAEAICSNIIQGWELETGGRYQTVLTTKNGLWRYLMDDIIDIIGFDPHSGSPVFKYVGRKEFVMRLPSVDISDAELVAAIRAVSSEEYILVLDFTTILDGRKTPETVGFIVELSKQPGPNACTTASRLSDALGAENYEYRRLARTGEVCLPTIRVVEPGTFRDYRQWRGEKMNTGLGQVKVPVVMSHVESQEWILRKVIQEL